jgi:hypothetical protein
VIRRCENEARDTAEDFFAKNSATVKAKFREEMLAAAAQKLHKAGKTAEEMVAQLGVDAEFIRQHTNPLNK